LVFSTWFLALCEDEDTVSPGDTLAILRLNTKY
jgi:hypothetical protein